MDSQLFAPTNSDIQDLLKQLKDINSKLQSVKDEEEEVNIDIRKRQEELDHRMVLLMQVDERLCDTLVELDSIKQEKGKLVQQIKELSDVAWTTTQGDASLSDLWREEAQLMEQENDMKLQCEQLKKILKGTERNQKKGKISQKDIKTKEDCSGQRETPVKMGRKRVERKYKPL